MTGSHDMTLSLTLNHLSIKASILDGLGAGFIGRLCSGRHHSRTDADPVIFSQFFLSLTTPRVYDQQNEYPESPKNMGSVPPILMFV